jgi:hypothetical protein
MDALCSKLGATGIEKEEEEEDEEEEDEGVVVAVGGLVM